MNFLTVVVSLLICAQAASAEALDLDKPRSLESVIGQAEVWTPKEVGAGAPAARR